MSAGASAALKAEMNSSTKLVIGLIFIAIPFFVIGTADSRIGAIFLATGVIKILSIFDWDKLLVHLQANKNPFGKNYVDWDKTEVIFNNNIIDTLSNHFSQVEMEQKEGKVTVGTAIRLFDEKMSTYELGTSEYEELQIIKGKTTNLDHMIMCSIIMSRT